MIDEDNSTTYVNTSTTSFSSNITEYIYTNSEIQIKLDVKNEGKAASGSYKVRFYLSTDNKISNSQYLFEKSFSNTLPNSVQSNTVSISHWHFANKLGILGIAYIHVKLDIDDDVDEVDESNNSFSSRRVNIKNTSSKPNKLGISPHEELTDERYNALTNDLVPYRVSVYSINQIKIKEAKVSNIFEENQLLKDLPIGLYIINSSTTSRKVYKLE
ncbi:CARDB domain-containing protein [uncultured Lutibacter sp.]|uniref:CARDB domain-containing protein n=1 Tax=uncultured Lutibacter sp. TaxID=437739 RepID=UPI00343425B8